MFVPLLQPSWASFAVHIVVVKSRPTQKHMASCKTRSKRFGADNTRCEGPFSDSTIDVETGESRKAENKN